MDEVDRLIEQRLDEQGVITAAEIVEQTGLSRQAVNIRIRKLRESGLVKKLGRTRGARYVRSEGGSHPGASLERVLPNRGLEEDRVFDRFALELGLGTALLDRAREIYRYAFTELLNNAIEHSESDRIRIRMEIGPFDAEFVIWDYGIGIFERIRRDRGLDSEAAALTDLLKGKTTTAPDRHSGEGVFFTLRCADEMAIESHRMAVRVDNREGRTLTETIRNRRGTTVRFTISSRTRRKLASVFDRHGGEVFDYTFAKTRVLVRLTGYGSQGPVSRSEARRLLAGLAEFRVVDLDFSGVKSLGQAFADEVFRVFANLHPDCRIEVSGATPAVRAMIDHVRVD